jgi:hypothetical protein
MGFFQSSLARLDDIRAVRCRAQGRRLLLPRLPQVFAGGYEPAFELGAHPVEQRAGGVAHLLLNGGVGIEIGVAGGVWFPVSDISVELRGRSGGANVHEAKPIGNAPSHVLDTLDVPMHDDGEQPTREMAGIIPALELDLLRQLGVLALRARWIRIASVSADEPVHHQLERR